MDDEKLILLVQANECLYNKYCPDYKKPEKKRNIWRQISAQMEHPEDVCQKRWLTLRDRYAKEKRRENLPTGSGAKCTSPWVLMQIMDFIAPHIVPRPMRSSCSFYKEIYNSNSQLSSSPTASPSPLPAQSPAIASSPLPELSSEEFLFEPIVEQATPVNPKRKRPQENGDQQLSQAVDAFRKLCESRMNKPEENDALAGFGKMIVETIRTMGPSTQIIAMQKVTSLVMEMNLEESISYEYISETEIE